MNYIVDIEVLPLQTEHEVLPGFGGYTDYRRWFWYQGQLYSLLLMNKLGPNMVGWDFITSTPLATVVAAVLDANTVRVGRLLHDADNTTGHAPTRSAAEGL